MTLSRCADRGRVDRHFEGELAPADERAMREHLPSCPSCTSRYERHLLLEAIDPEGLGPERRIGRGLGLGTSAGTSLRWMAPVGAALAIAACLMLVLGLRDRPDAGFTARGGDALSGAEVFVYRAVDHGLPTRADAVLGPRDELAFAYDNPSAKPYLMIFGVDEHRKIVWYYPAWSRESDDPVSIRAETTPGRHRLGEAIAHDLEGRSLEIHALFSDAALSVKAVERMIVTSPLPASTLPSPPKLSAVFPAGVIDRSVAFTVER
jgi:hypothetical protein